MKKASVILAVMALWLFPLKGFSVPFAYIGNSEGDTISVIDCTTNKVVGNILPGLDTAPYGVVANPNGLEVYVSLFLGHGVSIINTLTNKVRASVTISNTYGVKEIALNAAQNKAFVVGTDFSGNNSLSVINLINAEKIDNIPIFGATRVAATPDGKLLYVTDDYDTVTVVNGETHEIVGTLPLARPTAVTVNPATSKAYVRVPAGAGGLDCALRILSGATSEGEIPLPGCIDSFTFSPDGSRIYATDPWNSFLYVIDTGNPSATSTVPTGKTPRGVSITPDGSRIYVANYGDDTVSVFNAADLTPVALIPVGMKPLSIGHFIADVPLSGKTITIIPTGTGSGTVTSYPPGINCGSDCAEAYSDGQTITLTASADGGSVFAGWSGGGCSGINPCVITLTADVTVTATFILRPQLPIDEGTIGTQITITGSDFGIKKGKVLIGNVATKITSWADTLITCTVTKVPLPAETAYDVTIMSKEVGTITLPKAFTVKLPEPAIDPGVNDHGASGDPITINGNFFGTKKGKAYLEYLGKNKNCKVTDWNMTSITFLVPKKLAEGKYPLNITNKIGTVGVVGFTIDPPLP